MHWRFSSGWNWLISPDSEWSFPPDANNEILVQCEKAFENKSTFYKKSFVNYRGKTVDTKEYYTEVIAEFLCENINDYVNGMNCISRKNSYKTAGHDGIYDPDSYREEEKDCNEDIRTMQKVGSI